MTLVRSARRAVCGRIEGLIRGRNRASGTFLGVGLLLLVTALLGYGIFTHWPPNATPTAVPTPTMDPTPTPRLAPRAFSLPLPPSRPFVEIRRQVNPTAIPAVKPTMVATRNVLVGTEHTFQVWDPQQPTVPTRVPLRARLIVQSPHANWYVQEGLSLSPKTLAEAIRIFEDQSYPEVHRLHGWNIPPSVDGNSRVTILICRFPAMYSGAVAFDVRDLQPRSVFAGSNQRKLLSVNATAIGSDTSPLTSQLSYALTLLAWEVGRPDQDGWVKVGTAWLSAQEASGSPSLILDSYMINMFGLSPETSLTTWRPVQGNPNQLALVGAQYLFARYVADRFGATSVFPAIFASSDRGIIAYDRFFRSLQPATSFDAVFADWVAANYLDNPKLADGRFGYRSDITVTSKVLPGPTFNETVGGHANPFGVTYYQIQHSAAATLTFTGDRTVPLIAANPRVGGYEWWSNRGDGIDSRLTRTVDLRSVKTATLHFWTWYDVEQFNDYAYVEVSTDTGKTWRTLATPDTTSVDPNDRNLGDGFTGISGGTSPRWVHESVDLSPEAGRTILLRFEYVTGPVVNGDGFVVDDVEIPEIKFHDNGDSDNGWIAEGFVRTDNVVPQPWLVEVLSSSPTSPVHRLSVGPNGQSSLTLSKGQSVVVAVAGMSPYASQEATYQLRLTPRSSAGA